jgi:hypothetical protein
MIDKDYYSKALDYQKAATDNAFTILTILQSSTEQIVTKTMDNIPWLSAYGKEGCHIWFNSCKSTTDNLKEAIDKGFTSAESTLVKPAPKTLKKAPVVKAAPATKRKTTAKSKPKSTAASKVTEVKTTPQEKNKPQPAKLSTSSQPAKTEAKKPSQQDITSITQQSTPSGDKESKKTKPGT